MVLVQKEVQKVYMCKPYTDYSAMQGPCPDGFHVPMGGTNSEWTAVYNILVSFGLASTTNATGFVNYLKMPAAGIRSYSNGNQGSAGTYGGYTTAVNGYSSTSSGMYHLDFRPSGNYVRPNVTNQSSAVGLSIRPFKNEAEIPTSSWTVLYQGSGNSGIFHNASGGLISLSSNGTNWITIADKNLGATTVYNNGDTLSEANCGKYFQRGNNYPFPRTGTITTSTTLVNASSYGPSNSYYSSTFIMGTYAGWDSSKNKNLRGGETGTTTLWQDIQIRPEPYIPQEYTDTLTTTYNQSTNSTTYYYGEKFTALKSGQITEVGFLHSNTLVGLMVILDAATNTPTNFSLSASNTTGGVYTLDTPYNIEEGKSYIIGVKRSSGNNLPYYNVNMGYPITGDVIQYTNGVSMTTSYGVSLQVAGYVFKYIKTLA